jgi:hypothetical protein
MINNDIECEVIFNRIQILKLVKPDITIKPSQRKIIQGELDDAIKTLTAEWDEYNNRTYPEGKLNKHDEGELALKIGTEQGSVVIDFGKPTQWIGLPPDQAVEFALIIIERAKEIGLKKPITIELP